MKQKLVDYVNFNYFPYTRKKLLKRLFSIWIVSSLLLFFLSDMATWFFEGMEKKHFSLFPQNLIILLVICFAINCFFSILIMHWYNNKRKQDDYKIEGTVYGYLSLIFLSTLFFGEKYDKSNELYFIFMGLSLLLYVLVIIGTIILIDKYIVNHQTSSPKNNCKNISIIALISGIAGISFGRIFLANVSQNLIYVILLVILYLLSIVFAFCGCGMWMKSYYSYKYNIT